MLNLWISLRRTDILTMPSLPIYEDSGSGSEITQLCPTLCDPMVCSPPGSYVHGIFQARILEWVAISKKGNTKECSSYCTFSVISHASKVMLKILQARFQRYMNCELPDVQARFRKGRETRGQIANVHWIIDKAREFQKNIYFNFIDYVKALTVWITTNHGKFFKRWEYQATLPGS